MTRIRRAPMWSREGVGPPRSTARVYRAWSYYKAGSSVITDVVQRHLIRFRAMNDPSSSKYLKYRQRLGKRLAGLIKEKGYPSIENFALSNGMHKATVHQVIKASADPRLSTLLRIADALEVSLDGLVRESVR